MNGLDSIAAVSIAPEALSVDSIAEIALVEQSGAPTDFGSILTKGIAEVESKVNAANTIVREFALDDSIPVHQVTMALGEARLAVELAVQVRTRLIEGYREIMNMQL